MRLFFALFLTIFLNRQSLATDSFPEGRTFLVAHNPYLIVSTILKNSGFASVVKRETVTSYFYSFSLVNFLSKCLNTDLSLVFQDFFIYQPFNFKLYPTPPPVNFSKK